MLALYYTDPEISTALEAHDPLLGPAFGYAGSPSIIKVIKIAEYIPVIGMIVGCAHLIYSAKKFYKDDCHGAEGHIIRSLVAMTNFGLLLVIDDVVAEIFRRWDQQDREYDANEAFNRVSGAKDNLLQAKTALTEAIQNRQQEQTPLTDLNLKIALGSVRIRAEFVIDETDAANRSIHDLDRQTTLQSYKKDAQDSLTQIASINKTFFSSQRKADEGDK
jgi:hypothetical protein